MGGKEIKNEHNLQPIQPAPHLERERMFSFTSGLFFILAREPLGEFLGASPTVMTILAVVMFFYAALIAFNAQR